MHWYFFCRDVTTVSVQFQRSIGLPDIHAGYGFAIGNMAAFDVGDPQAVVSPGGVGFDINCGVRLVRTNLFERDVEPIKEQLAQVRFYGSLKTLLCSADVCVMFCFE